MFGSDPGRPPRGRPQQDRTIRTRLPLRPVSASGFDAFPLRPEIRRGIAAADFAEPRPVQVQTIPAALEGRDVLGLAATGTGKTAAFVLPILERLLASRQRGPRALVVAPTRELATQIQAEARVLAQFTSLRSATIFGGVSAGAQVQALRRLPDLLIACPGRLLDLWQQRQLRLDGIEVLVLDEADHLFDMGFLPDVRRIVAALPPKRQNLLFSATMPKEIRGLADRLLVRPHVVELAHSAPAATIAHALYPVAEEGKVDLLRHLLTEPGFTSAIVFLRTKHRAKRLAERLVRQGLDAVALQGNMSQAQRDRAMGAFRAGHVRVLVATDIAARGIDVAQVSHVVNFDVPGTPTAYTHRIGRTGRSERSGQACTFVTPSDADLVRAIERELAASIPRRHVPGLSPGSGRPVRDARGESAGRPSDEPRRRTRRPKGAGPGRGRRRRSGSSPGPARAAG